MRYSAVIFDLDGTLYNNRFLPLHLVAAKPSKALWMLAERIVRKRLSGKEFMSGEELLQTQYRQMAKLLCRSSEKVQQWFEMSYMPMMVKVIGEKHPVNSDVIRLVDYYRSKGCRIVLFSDYGMTREKLHVLNIDEDKFDLILDSVMLGGLKPCKRSFRRVLDMVDCKPGEVLMFGDREATDGIGCKNAGIDFVNVKKTDLAEFINSLK